MSWLSQEFNLADYYLFDRIAEGHGDRQAIRFGERVYSYDQVAQKSLAVCTLLGELGLRAGDRVYIVLPDMPPFAWTFFGALKSGAVVAMGNPLSSVDDLNYVIDYIQARVVVTTCLLYTSPSPRDGLLSRMPSSA